METDVQDKLRDLLAPSAARNWIALLPVLRTVTNVQSKFRLILSARDREVLCDYLSELRYALMFRSLGFDVEAEPLGKEGPDFRVRRDEKEAMLECMRLRRVHPGPSVLDLTDDITDTPLRLLEYGDPLRDTRKAFSKIIDKFPQIRDFEALLAIWNDDGDLEEFEVYEALAGIVTDAVAEHYHLPPGLRAVVYASPWSDVRTEKQVFCFELGAVAPPVSGWIEELRRLTVEEAWADLRSRSSRDANPAS